jgi:VCBS repeat-containing protein
MSWTNYPYFVESSDPWVASGYIYYDDSGYACLKLVAGRQAGKATITVTAADGSGRKATLVVTVKNDS